jgi:hypothetical protein
VGSLHLFRRETHVDKVVELLDGIAKQLGAVLSTAVAAVTFIIGMCAARALVADWCNTARDS